MCMSCAETLSNDMFKAVTGDSDRGHRDNAFVSAVYA